MQKQEQNNSKDTSLKILSTGIPDLEASVQLNSMAKKYGFKYYGMGCVVSRSRGDSIQKVNALTYKILENRYGKSWRTNFAQENSKMNQILWEMQNSINTILPKDNRYFYYLITPTMKKNIFEIKAYKYDNIMLTTYYKIIVDVKNHRVLQFSEPCENLLIE